MSVPASMYKAVKTVPLFQRIYQASVSSPHACLVQCQNTASLCWILSCWIHNLLIKSGKSKLVVYLSEPSYEFFIEKAFGPMQNDSQIEWIRAWRDNTSLRTFICRFKEAHQSHNAQPMIWIIFDMHHAFQWASSSLEEEPFPWVDLLQYTQENGSSRDTMIIGCISKYISTAAQQRQLASVRNHFPSILETYDDGDGDALSSTMSTDWLLGNSIHASFSHCLSASKKKSRENLLISMEKSLSPKYSMRIITRPDTLSINGSVNPESIDAIQKISTFRVTQSQAEQQQRDRIELPYMKMQTKQIEPRTGMPTVLYYAEKIDDIDEEDPDADLDL